jgi:Protein ENHANCED DISEASE RESISTANCE 2, C-terminal
MSSGSEGDELEAAYEEQTRKRLSLKTGLKSLGSGVFAGLGLFALSVAPVVAVPVAIAGAGATWAYLRDKARKTEHLPLNTTVDAASAQRPSLRRLKFIVNWGKMEIAEVLLHEDANADKIGRILDSIVADFAPWVQRLNYQRGLMKTNAKQGYAELQVIESHLKWLIKFLESHKIRTAFSLANARFESLWTSGACSLGNRNLKLKLIFPTISETVSLFFSDPTTNDSETAFAVREVAQWISVFSSRPDVMAFLTSPIPACSSVGSAPTPRSDMDFPPPGAESEVGDEEQYFSASEGSMSGRMSVVREEDNQERPLPPSYFKNGIPFDDLLLKSVSSEDKHTWDGIDHATVNLRGATYLEDRVKVVSQPSMMETLCVDVFYTDTPVMCVSQSPQCAAYWLLKNRPDWFFFTINWRCDSLQVGVTWGCDKAKADWISAGDAVERRLLESFLEGSDEFRNSRLKIIPNVVDGPWIARKACGTTPAIIGKKLTTTYQYEAGRFIEATIDVFSSTAARTMLGVLVSAAKRLVIDVAVLVEGQRPDELPERIIGGFKVRYVDLTKCRRIAVQEPPPVSAGEEAPA